MLPERRAGDSLQHWLSESLREGILAGQLVAGLRLPATRTLAEQHGLSRGTVTAVYEQLAAEGYLDATVGRGSFVARVLPERRFGAGGASAVGSPTVTPLDESKPGEAPSRALVAGATWTASPFSLIEAGTTPRPFRAHVPDSQLFPLRDWSRIAARCARRISTSQLGSIESAGLPELREAIARHLFVARGVVVDAAQVCIVSSAQQALDLCLRLLCRSGDRVWLEDPGYPGTRALVCAHGLSPVDVPVDRHGLCVDHGVRVAPQARLACVTPSRQSPLGVPMSASRRGGLLAWAHEAGTYLIEDDYDSEYRYRGRPIAALKSHDTHERVVLIGTFSKLLFPSLRLAYAALPSDLVGPFVRAQALLARSLPSLEQRITAEFMLDGHFDRHLRRMRKHYAARAAALRDALARYAGELVSPVSIDAGLDAAVHLRRARSDRSVERRLAEAGIESLALSRYASTQALRPGLVLGFAAFDEPTIERAVRRAAYLIRDADR